MRQLTRLTLAVAIATSLPSFAHAQNAADSAGIRTAALDYIEGWYAGDGARMERALHPELAKRIVMTDPKSGRNQIQTMSALTLVNSTRGGGGSRTPEARKQKDYTLLDIYQNAASAKIVASDWVDYLQLAKWQGRWVIVNVLWELKPQPAQ
ncbi:MAG: nuclear transport factor 2 family protein [bacterium]